MASPLYFSERAAFVDQFGRLTPDASRFLKLVVERVGGAASGGSSSTTTEGMVDLLAPFIPPESPAEMVFAQVAAALESWPDVMQPAPAEFQEMVFAPTASAPALVAGTNITLTAVGDTITIAAGGGSGNGDIVATLVNAEQSVTTGTTLTSGAFGKMHACSGSTSDYTVTLPAASGNAGKIIGLRMAAGLTKLVTIDGDGSETIDGAASRVMWAGESAILLCDGTGWAKIAGKSRPMQCVLTKNVAQSIATATATIVTLDATYLDVGSLSNLSGNAIVIRRAGRYFVTGSVEYDNGSATNRTSTAVILNGTAASPALMAGEGNFTITGRPICGCSAEVSLAAADSLTLLAFHSAGASRDTFVTGASPMRRPFLNVIEQIDW